MNENNQLILIEDLGLQYPNENATRKRRYGIFKCFCGNTFKTRIDNIKSKETLSCGCYQKSKASLCNKKHGLYQHRLYNTWKGMIDRCNVPSSTNYKDYGERGIKVCDRWLDINNFIDDMFPSFQEGLTLDRINVNGNYEPSNCRWATKTTQSRNKRLIQKNNTSGYRGVYFCNTIKRFMARIVINSKNNYLGSSKSAYECALMYDNYVIENNLEHTRNFS